MNRSSAVELHRPVIAYLLSFIAIGLSVSMLGPALSELRDRSGAGLGGIGVLFVGQAAGYIIGSFVAGRLYDRFDGHAVYSGAFVALAIGIGALPSLGALSTLFLTFVLVGVGSSTVDVGANTLLMWQLGDQVGRPMNILHLCFGVGALLSPLIVHLGLDFAAYLAAVICLALAVVMRTIPSPSAPTVVRVEHSDTTRPMLAMLSAFFCLYVGLEAGFASWIHTYGEEIEFSDLAATWLTSAFWVGFTGGRLLSSVLGHRFRPKVVLAAACWLTILAAGVLVIGDGGTAAVWIGAVLMGVATAPQFPAMFTYLERRIRMTGNATAWMVGASGLGGLVFPWLIGQWFDGSGPSALPWSMLGLGVLTLASFGVSNRRLGG